MLNDIKKKIKSVKICSEKEFRKLTGVLISEPSGKMDGVKAITTSCVHNAFCQEMMKDEKKICSKCYAHEAMTGFRGKNMQAAYKKNQDVLTSDILEYVPRTTCIYFRFQTHGELNNITECINYILIARKNPQTKFALWTKRLNLVNQALEYISKPKNLQIVASSFYTNEPLDISDFPFVDKVFTVYDMETAIDQEININCGSADCFGCHKCYTRNKVDEISEVLKKELKSYEKATANK